MENTHSQVIIIIHLEHLVHVVLLHPLPRLRGPVLPHDLQPTHHRLLLEHARVLDVRHRLRDLPLGVVVLEHYRIVRKRNQHVAHDVARFVVRVAALVMVVVVVH
jgi:hypothetical protein